MSEDSLRMCAVLRMYVCVFVRVCVFVGGAIAAFFGGAALTPACTARAQPANALTSLNMVSHGKVISKSKLDHTGKEFSVRE